jgi:hypothetical protein
VPTGPRAARCRADGGDVLASNALARVSDSSTPVDEPMVQLLRGAAYGVEHVRFYSAYGFTAEAIAFALRAGVELFVWDEKSARRAALVAAIATLAIRQCRVPKRTVLESVENSRSQLLWLLTMRRKLLSTFTGWLSVPERGT